MDLPDKIVIDTSTFRAAGFNYDSLRMAALNEMLQFTDIELLMPDPVIRELAEHFETGIIEAWKCLEKVKKNNPLVRCIYSSDWRREPQYNKDKALRAAWRDFGEFIKRFKSVRHLGYEYANIFEVMDWKDMKQSPFSDRKQKEYSDALIISIAKGYATFNDCRVVIISGDNDIFQACQLHDELICYKNPFDYADAKHPNVQGLVNKKRALVSDSKFMRLISDSIFGSEIIVRRGWNESVKEIEVKEINSIEFQGIMKDNGMVRLQLTVNISCYVTVSYDTVDERSEYPWKETDCFFDRINIDGVLTGLEMPDKTVECREFESANSSYAFG